MVAPIAFVFTGLLAVAGLAVAMRDRTDLPTRTLGGAVSMVTWGVWAFQAKGITRSTGGTELVYESYGGLFFVGLMLSLVLLLVFAQLALATLVAAELLEADRVPGGGGGFVEDT